DHGRRVGCGDRVDVGEEGARHRGGLRIDDAVERVLHVRARERVAVVELDAGADLHGDRLAIRRGGGNGLGEVWLNAEVLVQSHEIAVNSSNTRAEVNAGTLCGSRFVTSPARARMSVPPFFG